VMEAASDELKKKGIAAPFGENWKSLPQEKLVDLVREALKDEVVDKRKAMAFLLTTIAQIRKPGYPEAEDATKHLLYPRAAERVIAVVGLYEYSLAFQGLAQAFVMMRPQIVQLIQHDRDGVVVTAGDQKRTLGGFVVPYRERIEELREAVHAIELQQERLARLQQEKTGAEAIVKEQADEVKKLTEDLMTRRKETAKRLAELKRLQRDWFEAQTIVRDAQEVNERLESELRKAQGLKGGRK